MTPEEKAFAEGIAATYRATQTKLVLACLSKVPDEHRWYVKLRMQEESSVYAIDDAYQRSKT